jgi:hypothetical protein
MKKDMMDGACSMHGGDEKYVQNIDWKPQESNNLGDLGIDGRIILK